MKKLTVVLSFILLAVLCVLSASAAEDYIVWNFSDPVVAAKWAPSGSTQTEVTEKGLKIYGEGDDLNISYKADSEIILDNYKYLMIEFTDSDVGGGMQLYHWTEGCTGNPVVGQWVGPCAEDAVKQYTLDLEKNAPDSAQWTGKVTKLRLDPFRGSSPRKMTIMAIGLFKDSATYEKYIEDNRANQVPAGQPVALFNPAVTNPCFPTRGTDCTIDYADNYAVVTSFNGPEEGEGKNGDPYFSVRTDFNGERWQWMKIRLRNLSEATQFEMHFVAQGTNNSLTAASCTHFPITAKDNDFVEYIVNVREANMAFHNTTEDKAAWSGNVSSVRFDCMWIAEPSGQVPSGSQMYIDYVGFFRSEEEAKAYTPDASTEIETPRKNSGAEAPTWILDTEEEIAQLDVSGADVSFSGGVLKLVPNSADPSIRFSVPNNFDSSEFPYFAYRHSTKSKGSEITVFYTTDKGATFSNAYTSVSVSNDGSWSNTIYDMDTYTGSLWNGNITSLRIDPMGGEFADAVAYIDRFGFFRTRREALAFLNEGRTSLDYTASATLRADYQTAIIPRGTLYEGYKEADFLLSATSPTGEGTDPVVVRTSADGTREIVALGYTNQSGYTTFVANKPATYTIEYNTRSYSDTVGHWGEQYINFVSNRTLFGGTSPTEFSPDMPMTRGMFITVLGRMHGVDTSKYDGNTGYGDVPATEYYAPYIQWAKELGIMSGTTDTAFEPEAPVLRQTMAAVISKYAEFSGFKMQGYADEMEFSDLAGIDEATASAIKSMQKLGIINGKGEGIFDPTGLSTRAEVATVMQRVIKTVLGVNTATTTYTADYFTRDHIKIGAWSFPSTFANEEGMEKLRDLGVNLIIDGSAVSSDSSRSAVLNYADKFGISVHLNAINPIQMSDADIAAWDPAARASEFAHHPSFVGSHIMDEPGTDHMPTLKAVIDNYHKSYPEKRAFVNLLPMYANAAQLKGGAGAAAIEYYDSDPELYRNYCREWFEQTDSDYICVDIYPLHGTTGQPSTWTTYTDYCESINQVATVARENAAEFWCCIQTWGWTEGKRTPTEGEFRWQSYTLMSYGCKGLLLWALSTVGLDYPSVFSPRESTVNEPLYNDCATVMWEIRNLSDIYVQYNNLGAFTVNCTEETPWLKMSGEYEDFDILADVKSAEPLLIGCFEKEEGTGYAFTVVNMTDLKENMGATVRFKLAEDLNVTLYSKAQPTVLEKDADGYYTINLESTDGVFVTVG